MPVTYLEKEKLFHLTAADVSYVIAVYKDCYPMHVYYGKAIPAEDVSWYLETPYRRRGLIGGTHPDDPMFLREYFPFEYPSYGTSDFRNPAFELRAEDGSCVSDLRLEEYKIFSGKPALAGLPSTYCESDEEVQTLVLTMYDPRLDLHVDLYYSIYENSGVICRHTEFRAGKKVTLRNALSMSIDFKKAPYEMLQLCGTALRETHVVRRQLTNGTISVDSMRGISSHQANPFFALVEKETTEGNGDCYGFSLVYSGNFTARIQCDMHMMARVQMGIHPQNFSWQLLPGESFTTPEVVLAYSGQGISGMSQKLHSTFRSRLCRGEWRDKLRPVVINTWEAAYFTFDEEKIMAIAREAAKVGVEMLVLDDGWFGHRDDENSSLGDWFISPKKLPHGLDGLARQVNDLGMKFGLWFEPEMISPDSDLYRTHPDWCIHVDGVKRSEWRYQLVLDLTRPEVREYLVDSISKVLHSANIEYLKWDCNRRITEPGTPTLPADRQDEFFHRYVLGLYEIMDRLTKAFPHVLFENCASGGARNDPGMMAYFPQTWISDNSDGECRLKIQYGNSMAYAPVMMTAHVSACPNHQVERTTPFNFRGDVSMPFNLGYELNLCILSEEEKQMVAQQIAKYKEIRPLVQTGNFLRLLSPFEGDKTAWMTLAQDGSEFMVWYYKPTIEPEESYVNLRLRQLEADAHYTETTTGRRYSGAALMHMGLPIDMRNGDDFSQAWHFVKD